MCVLSGSGFRTFLFHILNIMFFLHFSDTSPLLNKSGSEHMFETMEMEIEQLLSKVEFLQDHYTCTVVIYGMFCTSDFIVS